MALFEITALLSYHSNGLYVYSAVLAVHDTNITNTAENAHYLGTAGYYGTEGVSIARHRVGASWQNLVPKRNAEW